MAALQDQINEQRLAALRSRKELATAQAVTQKAKELARTAVGIAQRTQGQLDRSPADGGRSRLVANKASTPSRCPSVVPWVAPSAPGQSLEWLVARFNEHSEHVEKLKPKTLSQRKQSCAFLDVLGPLDSAALDAADIAHYREVIRTLPKNLPKQPIWKERPRSHAAT